MPTLPSLSPLCVRGSRCRHHNQPCDQCRDPLLGRCRDPLLCRRRDPRLGRSHHPPPYPCTLACANPAAPTMRACVCDTERRGEGGGGGSQVYSPPYPTEVSEDHLGDVQHQITVQARAQPPLDPSPLDPPTPTQPSPFIRVCRREAVFPGYRSRDRTPPPPIYRTPFPVRRWSRTLSSPCATA